MIDFYSDNKIMIDLLCAVVIGAAAVTLLILSVERWLICMLNGLDKALTRIGFGKWSARMLTSAEDWFRERKAKR